MRRAPVNWIKRLLPPRPRRRNADPVLVEWYYDLYKRWAKGEILSPDDSHRLNYLMSLLCDD